MKSKRKQSGGTLVEYLLLTLLVGIFLITAVSLFGEGVAGLWQSSAETVVEALDS
jgi:Flp pilus assembly pilin Flp